MQKTARHALILAALAGAYMTRDASAIVAPAASGKRTPEQATTRLAEMRGRTDLRRSLSDASTVDLDARTVDLSFSSTTEVPRWFGKEVLSHAPGAMRTGRLQARAPLLWNHNWDDQRGVVLPETVRMDGNKGRATVKLSRSPAGEQLLQDMADGIVTNVSVGYRVHDAQLIEVRDDDEEVWLITDWEPYEITACAVPADIAVGVGRAMEKPQEEKTAPTEQNSPHLQTRIDPQPKGKQPMNIKVLRNAAGHLVRAEVDEAGNIVKELEVLERAGDDVQAHIRTGTGAEARRVRSLLDMGDTYGKLVKDAGIRAAKAVRENKSPEQFQAELLEAMNERADKPLGEQTDDANIGLSDAEVQRFSFLRAVRAMAPNATPKDRQAAAFEFEVSEAAQRAYGKQAKGILIPTEVLSRAFNAGQNGQATFNTGGNAIATNLLAGSFIELLRNKTTIMRLATTLGGLVGNIDIPKQTGGAQGYWIGEGDDATEGAPTLGQIAMSPKTVAAYTDLTRRLMMQSTPDAEGIVRRDLAHAMALALDFAGYYGSGTAHQPLGLKGQAGINVQKFAAANPTFAELVAMETDVAISNADVDGMAYVANARFRGYAKTNLKFPAAANQGGTIWEPGNTVNGYRAEITNQVAAGDVFFGNFADFIIAMWGGLDLTVDPYSLSKSGGLRLVTFQDVDMALRHAVSMSYGNTAAVDNVAE